MSEDLLKRTFNLIPAVLTSFPQSAMDAKIERADKALKDAGVLLGKIADGTRSRAVYVSNV
jgi:hypothetical protein